MEQLVQLRLDHRAPSDPDLHALFDALRAQVRGDVRFDDGSRALYATDASNYRHVPIGVVVPLDVQDVVRTLAVCHAHRVPVLSRGGGTSLAGQCCNAAVVIETSKHLREVLELDPRGRRARVQPGVILDDLRSEASRYGLTFGPDPATHNHCTLGGMLGNNACGIHAIQAEFFGPGARTADNVEELEILTYDGLRMRVGPTSEEELERIIAEGGRRGDIYRRLRDLRDQYADLIRARFPQIPRRVSGYNLPALLPENGFNVARALVGTESTCVTILEATVSLIEDFSNRVLLVLGYPSVYEAGDDIPAIRSFEPIGLEGIDDALVEYIKVKGLGRGYAQLPEGSGWLLVEFGGKTHEEAADKAHRAAAELGRRPNPPAAEVVEAQEKQETIWALRESGLGATAFVPGQPDAWPGWEDSAVPPDQVGAYLRDLRGLLGRYGYEAALYGHFGQGCIHCRITFDLASAEGIEKFRRFTQEAAELVMGYGGSLSGEHGDGQARGDLLEVMYGPELMEAFREFKAIWDPDHRMNPGKVVHARGRTDDLRLGAGYAPWRPQTYFQYPEDGGDFAHATLRCVGVGKCRRFGGGTMCPSYMVTGEEMHTTRGRAHLLFEMLQGDAIAPDWNNEPVREALDLCLSCKGCKNDCPVNVDMATYKAEFLAHYYRHNRRPRHAYAFGWIHRWARLASLVPDLANFVTQTPGLRGVAKWLAGMAPEREIPRFAPRTFRRWYAERDPKSNGAGRTVMLWPDTFNDHFFPETLSATAEVLERAGCHVVLPRRHLCCGRPLYDYGMLDLAGKLWMDILNALEPEIDAGIPLVGVEPSCVAAFRDELANLFPHDERAQRLSRQTFTLAELLEQELPGYEPPRLKKRALMHGHCHHKAIMQIDSEQSLLARMGLEVEQPKTGCCGMAGAFGFEKDKYEVSVAAGERVLLPAVRAANEDTLIIADGFSCREQIQQHTGRKSMHVAEVLQLAYREAERAERSGERPERIAQAMQPRSLIRGRASVPTLAAAMLGGAFVAYKLASWLGRAQRPPPTKRGRARGARIARGTTHPRREVAAGVARAMQL